MIEPSVFSIKEELELGGLRNELTFVKKLLCSRLVFIAWEIDIIVLLLQTRKLRDGEVK